MSLVRFQSPPPRLQEDLFGGSLFFDGKTGDAILDRDINCFRSAGIRQGWWDSGKMAVGLSGGSDSMALLWLMINRWHGEVVALHVDHGIRGASSSSDAEFVRDHCASIGIHCHVVGRDVPRELLKGESVELAARRVRHEALTLLGTELECHGVVLGHNSDDVVETFFLNLARGSGPFGLAGIPEVNGRLFRPVMGMSREDLRGLLRDAGWSWVDDETNDQDVYLRNRVRHELLPLMESRINSGLRAHVLSLVEDMADLRAQEEEEGEAVASRLRRDLPRCLYSFSRDGFKELGPRLRAWALRHVGRALGLRILARNRMQGLLDLEGRSHRWRFQWSSDVELCADRNFLSWVRRPVLEATSPEPFKLSGEGRGFFHDIPFRWSFRKLGGSTSCALSAAIPVMATDKVEVRALASFSQRLRTSCPWWLSAFVPVVMVNDLPVWSPDLGFWNSGWDFPPDSVKCEGLCLVSFRDPDSRQEGEQDR